MECVAGSEEINYYERECAPKNTPTQKTLKRLWRAPQELSTRIYSVIAVESLCGCETNLFVPTSVSFVRK